MDYNAAIELRYFTDDWGPYSIDLTGGLPDGAGIAGVGIKAYPGRVEPDANLSGLTDVASEVIESGSISYSGTLVFWKMQYPSDETLKGQKLTLIFEVTTSDGNRHPFYLYKVKVA